MRHNEKEKNILKLAADRLTHQIIETVYPARCIACPSETAAAAGLCAACWSDMSFVSGVTCTGCGRPLPGEEATGAPRCDTCLAAPPNWNSARAAILYEGAGRGLILSLKHGDRLDLVPTLAGWLATAAAPMLQDDTLIAPVPLHRWRLWRRRFNQSAELARALARRTGHAFCPDLLTRTRATRSQGGLNQKERRENLVDAIALTPRHAEAVRGRHVLLIDDVMTTGATLTACAGALRGRGARQIDVAVLARVADRDRIDL